MLRRVLPIALLLAIGCGSDREEAPRPAPKKPPAPAPSSTQPTPVDPWASKPDDGGLPDSQATTEIADAACPRVTGPYFYQIEKNGHVAYLLGTRHLGVGVAKFPPIVVERLRAAKVAVFETPPGDDPEHDKKEGPPLSERLGPDLWARYQKLVGRDLASELDGEEPATALLMMIALWEDKRSALDEELQRIAQKAHIPVEGLETSAFQDKLIEKWLDLKALRAALKTADDRAELRRETVEDLTEYCAGTDDTPGPDPDERADMLAGGYTPDDIARYEEDLVFARNRDWIPKIEKLVARGDAFIAVGADHLIGDKGVVALLTTRGYQVTRIKGPSLSHP